MKQQVSRPISNFGKQQSSQAGLGDKKVVLVSWIKSNQAGQVVDEKSRQGSGSPGMVIGKYNTQKCGFTSGWRVFVE